MEEILLALFTFFLGLVFDKLRRMVKLYLFWRGSSNSYSGILYNDFNSWRPNGNPPESRKAALKYAWHNHVPNWKRNEPL